MEAKSEVKLDYPIETKTGRIESLVLRRPTVQDWMVLDKKHPKGSESQEWWIDLISNLSMQSPTDIMKLDISDYIETKRILDGFFVRKQRGEEAQL